MINPLQVVVDVAREELGTLEDPNHPNQGKAIRKYKEHTELNPDDAWPWCAAFVSFVVAEADERSETISLPVPPRLARAFDFEDWGQKRALVFYPDDAHYQPAAGDIVVFNFSHVGIVEVPVINGKVISIDGNTNEVGSREGDGVYRKKRAIDLVKCFVRLPARAKIASES